MYKIEKVETIKPIHQVQWKKSLTYAWFMLLTPICRFPYDD